MSIVLFALIGAAIKANSVYWTFFGLFTMFKLIKYVAIFFTNIDKK